MQISINRSYRNLSFVHERYVVKIVHEAGIVRDIQILKNASSENWQKAYVPTLALAARQLKKFGLSLYKAKKIVKAVKKETSFLQYDFLNKL